MRSTQIAAARELLRWTQSELANRARIDRRTIMNIEAGRHVANSHTLSAIRRAFEAAGVDFIDEIPKLKPSIP
jgi:transcriptional regulator with XRE-family HTH domain